MESYNIFLSCLVCLLISTQVLSQDVVNYRSASSDYVADDYSGIVCLVDEFKCKDNSKCISNNKLCDGNPIPDCPDGSDEENCTGISTTASTSTTTEDYYSNYKEPCTSDQFECREFCIDNISVCDGADDCLDGRDELGCNKSTTTAATAASTTTTESTYEYENCLRTQFECGDGICLSYDAVCDGFSDCFDSRDEMNCTVSPTTASITTTEYNYEYESCLEDEFDCKYGICILKTAVCDGYADCDDTSDEKNCTEKTTENPATTAPVDGVECRNDEVDCGDGACVPLIAKCDGFHDCNDGSDEWNCPVRPDSTTTTVQSATTSGLTCYYDNQEYPAGSQIILNNCTEISCSQSGRLLTWNNPDAACGATTTRPPVPSTTSGPQPPNQNEDVTKWVENFETWRRKAFYLWLPTVRNYMKNSNTKENEATSCPSWPALSCGNTKCIKDLDDCRYCYCKVSSSDCKAYLMKAWQRDFKFWEDNLEPAWSRTLSEYKSNP